MAQAHFNITPLSSAPTDNLQTNDVYLDDGTNTANGLPGFRRYNGSAWGDVGVLGGAATVQTTDATVTDIATIALAEGDAITVRATITGAIADYSAALGVVLSATFRRATGGNVTLVGSVQGTVQEDSASAPTATLAADTGNQTIDIRVTGVAAQTWNWSVRYETLVVTV